MRHSRSLLPIATVAANAFSEKLIRRCFFRIELRVVPLLRRPPTRFVRLLNAPLATPTVVELGPRPHNLFFCWLRYVAVLMEWGSADAGNPLLLECHGARVA